MTHLKTRIILISIISLLLFIVGCSDEKYTAEPKKDSSLVGLIKEMEDVPKIEQQLKAGVNPNQPNEEGDYPLHIAVSKGDFTMVKLLLKYKAQINLQDRQSVTPLMIALGGKEGDYSSHSTNSTSLRKGGYDMAKYLLDHNARADLLDNRGQNAIWYAIKSREPLSLQLLLVKNTNVNQVDLRGETPLFAAVYDKQEEMAKRLIEAGAFVNHSNNNNVKLLDKILDMENVAVFRALVAHNLNLNQRNKKGEPLITQMVKNDKLTFLQVILTTNKVDVNVKDKYGDTALMIASNHEQLTVIDMLLRAKARIDEPNKYGQTPLMSAVSKGKTEVVRKLLTGNPNLSLKNKYGQTVMNYLDVSKGKIDPEITKLIQTAAIAFKK